MGTCRICQQECSEDQQFCSNCGYPLTAFPPTLGEIPQAFQEILSQRERWEQNIWQKYEQLQRQFQQLQQEASNNQQLQQQVGQLQQEIARLGQKLESQSSSQQQEEVPLKSAVGYNYTKLRYLLAKQKWQEADEETAKAMLTVAGRDNFLREKDIDNFP
ncbi:GUN4 domain-containing protein [Geitlerinema sp. PCC 9228]|uniref:GUN4 domain-containing protein n=1 Tax=Geitlerinema sp. PCC 9228 TaxID=111611 RepID=UPI0008F9DA81|nr:GUN4 domain-containing protein [Geitlerinema sp. PCC 9228]